MKKTLITLVATFVLIGGLVWLAGRTQTPAVSAGPSMLSANETSYDFGTVSMAAGKVMREFVIKNTGTTPLTINGMATSCMCTEAFLTMNDQVFGPFGMPGHGGAATTLNQTIDPDKEATIRTVFDPAAHGPAGVGRISRIVSIQTDDGRILELAFTANVTP